MNLSGMRYNAMVADRHDAGGCTRRLIFAAHRFQRKARLPNGDTAFKVAGIRRLESKLGRAHRF